MAILEYSLQVSCGPTTWPLWIVLECSIASLIFACMLSSAQLLLFSYHLVQIHCCAVLWYISVANYLHCVCWVETLFVCLRYSSVSPSILEVLCLTQHLRLQHTACSLASHTQPSAYLGLSVRSQTTCSVSSVHILTVGLRGVRLSEDDCIYQDIKSLDEDINVWWTYSGDTITCVWFVMLS